jgi:hypothetical protein
MESGSRNKFRYQMKIKFFPLVAGFANPSAATLAAGNIPFFPEMSHSMSQKPIGFGLIAAAVGFEPCDNVGIPMGNLDMMIAAHALAEEAVLVTNDRSFRRLKDLKIEDWTK